MAGLEKAFEVLEAIKRDEWPAWMLTTEYPCDACNKPIKGLTYKAMWLEDWESRKDGRAQAVLFFCDDCGDDWGAS